MSMTAAQHVEQERIIREGSGADACQFVRTIPDSDIKALEQVVIERGTASDAYEFAYLIIDSDREALRQVVIDEGDNLWIDKYNTEFPREGMSTPLRMD